MVVWNFTNFTFRSCLLTDLDKAEPAGRRFLQCERGLQLTVTLVPRGRRPLNLNLFHLTPMTVLCRTTPSGLIDRFGSSVQSGQPLSLTSARPRRAGFFSSQKSNTRPLSQWSDL